MGRLTAQVSGALETQDCLAGFGDGYVLSVRFCNVQVQYMRSNGPLHIPASFVGSVMAAFDTAVLR